MSHHFYSGSYRILVAKDLISAYEQLQRVFLFSCFSKKSYLLWGTAAGVLITIKLASSRQYVRRIPNRVVSFKTFVNGSQPRIRATVNSTRWNAYGKSVSSQTFTMNIISDHISPKEFGKFLVKILGDLVPRPYICNKSKFTLLPYLLPESKRRLKSAM